MLLELLFGSFSRGLRFDMVWQGHNPALRPVVLGSASMMFPSQPSPAILRFKVDRLWIGPQWWHVVRETHCNLRTKYFFPNATWHRSISLCLVGIGFMVALRIIAPIHSSWHISSFIDVYSTYSLAKARMCIKSKQTKLTSK